MIRLMNNTSLVRRLNPIESMEGGSLLRRVMATLSIQFIGAPHHIRRQYDPRYFAVLRLTDSRTLSGDTADGMVWSGDIRSFLAMTPACRPISSGLMERPARAPFRTNSVENPITGTLWSRAVPNTNRIESSVNTVLSGTNHSPSTLPSNVRVAVGTSFSAWIGFSISSRPSRVATRRASSIRGEVFSGSYSTPHALQFRDERMYGT